MDARRARWNLVQALRLLAAEPDQQVGALPDFVVVADELALIFDECYRLVDQMRAATLLDDRQVAKLREIDSVLEDMSRRHQAQDWTTDALAGRPEWARLRRLARQALSLLHVEAGAPDLGWLHYVKGRPERDRNAADGR